MVGVGNIVSFGGCNAGGSGGGSTSGIQKINSQTGPNINLIGTSGIVISPVSSNVINIGFAGSISGVSSLQGAYDGGKEVSIEFANDSFIPALFKMETPGGKCVEPLDLINETSSAIAVSGFSLTPENPNSFNFLRIGANGIVIRGSGTPAMTASTLFIGYDGCRTGTDDPDNALITTSGFLSFEVGQKVTANIVGSIDLNSTAGNINLRSGSSSPTSIGGQIGLSAFGGSGQLKYDLGPYESWHVSASHTNDFFPIAHSGQVTQMINERKFATDITDETNVLINHGLNTLDVIVQVRDSQSPPVVVFPDNIIFENLNQIRLLFNTPQTGRVVII